MKKLKMITLVSTLKNMVSKMTIIIRYLDNGVVISDTIVIVNLLQASLIAELFIGKTILSITF
jgi:hypothetical protein